MIKGYINSYYDPPTLRPYTSIYAHTPGPVHQIASNDKAIFSLSPHTIRISTRRGTSKGVFSNAEQFKSLSCFSLGRDNHDLYLGGNHTNELLRINIDAPGGSGSASENITHIKLSYDGSGNTPSVCKVVKTPHAIIAGKTNGMVDIIDPNSNQVVKTFRAHGGIISDMDTKETTILTCGYTRRATGLILDPLVNIFDIRAGKSLAPLAFPAGAGFVKLHPKLSTCAFVASHTGQIQILDFANPASSQVRLHQASLNSTGVLSGLTVSPSGDYLALADGPYVQLWNNRKLDSDHSVPAAAFNEYAKPIEFPTDPAVYITESFPPLSDEPPPYIDIDDDSVPLSAIGMPYYKDELLSSWSQEPGMPMIFNEGMPRSRIPYDVLIQIQATAAAAKYNNSAPINTSIRPTDPAHGGIGIMGTFPSKPSSKEQTTVSRRNVAQPYISFKEVKRNTTSSGPKLISERTTVSHLSPLSDGLAALIDDDDHTTSHSSTNSPISTPRATSSRVKLLTAASGSLSSSSIGHNKIPPAYRKLQIKYSKFGIADFDFAYYNRTQYSGLEPQLLNSYCNPLLQLYRYTQPMYEFALNSLRHNTLDDKSLLVELGLLFDMLSKANGQHVAAINFVKTLSAIPEANALGIIVDDANPLHNLDNLTAINAGIISGGSAPGGSSIDSNNRIEFNGSTAVVTLFGRSFRIPSSFLRQSSTTSSGSASSDLRNDNNNATGSIDQFSISATIMHSQGLILQSFSRFLLERIAIDERAFNKDSSDFDNVSGIKIRTDSSFIACNAKTSRNSVAYSIEMAPLSEKQVQQALRESEQLKISKKHQEWNRKLNEISIQSDSSDQESDDSYDAFENLFPNNDNDQQLNDGSNVDTTSPDSFLRILQNTFEKKTTSRSWCSDCHKYHSSISSKVVEELPEVLNLHIPLAIDNPAIPSSENAVATTITSSQLNNNDISGRSRTISGSAQSIGSASLSFTPSSASTSIDGFSNAGTSNFFIPAQSQMFSPSMEMASGGHAPGPPYFQPGPPNFFSPPPYGLPYSQNMFGPPLPMLGGQNGVQQPPQSPQSQLNLNARPFIPAPHSQQYTGEQSRSKNHETNEQNYMDLNTPFWRKENWPATYFAVRKVPENERTTDSPGLLKVIPASDRKLHDELYELVGFVVEINNSAIGHDGGPLDGPSIGGSAYIGQGGESHLISFVNIPISDAYGANDEVDVVTKTVQKPKRWHLFNDFLVKPVPTSEALNFSYSWKCPVILTYQRVHEDNSSKTVFNVEKWKSELDTSILYHDHFASGTREAFKREYELLHPEDEIPRAGDLVAIDTEFVLLHHEETEISSDGTKTLLRPKEMSLARVSVIRGQGPKQGIPFIDDFIASTETIVDYLTEFSGIEPGDLDPYSSPRGGLVTRQTSYKRLWLLLNLGCIFVGHGLSNDFRIVNIHVPENQIIDTSLLFHLPEYKRYLSLKFLAFALLNENVQTGNHDSIEDAVTALRLYKVYKKMQSKGPHAFENLLIHLYKEGKKCNFKPPKKGEESQFTPINLNMF